MPRIPGYNYNIHLEDGFDCCEAELAILKNQTAPAKLDNLESVEDAGDKYEPSIVTRHIVNIAQAFNRFYHDEHILVEDEKEKLAKLALVLATKQSIRNGLALLGINAPEKM